MMIKILAYRDLLQGTARKVLFPETGTEKVHKQENT